MYYVIAKGTQIGKFNRLSLAKHQAREAAFEPEVGRILITGGQRTGEPRGEEGRHLVFFCEVVNGQLREMGRR